MLPKGPVEAVNPRGQTMQWPKEKGQTMQWPNEKGQTMQWSTKYCT